MDEATPSQKPRLRPGSAPSMCLQNKSNMTWEKMAWLTGSLATRRSISALLGSCGSSSSSRRHRAISRPSYSKDMRGCFVSATFMVVNTSGAPYRIRYPVHMCRSVVLCALEPTTFDIQSSKCRIAAFTRSGTSGFCNASFRPAPSPATAQACRMSAGVKLPTSFTAR